MQHNELNDIYRHIVHWAAPVVVLGILHYLQKISARLSEISISLATIVTRLEVHEAKHQQHDIRFEDYGRRIGNLERVSHAG
jgi:hypothetical protein